MDVRAGLTPIDRAFADIVRKSGKPVIVVANKSEGRASAGAAEAYELGLGDPIPISAEHGEGLSDLYDAIRAALPEHTAPAEEEGTTPTKPRVRSASPWSAGRTPASRR